MEPDPKFLNELPSYHAGGESYSLKATRTIQNIHSHVPFTQIPNLDIVQIKQDIAELFSQVTIKDKIPNRKKRTKNPKQPELLATMKCKNQCCPVRYKVLRIWYAPSKIIFRYSVYFTHAVCILKIIVRAVCIVRI